MLIQKRKLWHICRGTYHGSYKMVRTMANMPLIAFTFFILFSIKSSAQDNFFRLPNNIPQPDWYRQTDWSNPNIFQIDALIRSEKSKKPKNKPKLENRSGKPEFEEDPFATAYLRWKMSMEPFLQPSGFVIKDTEYYTQLFHQSNTSLRTGNQGNWTPLGPMETFLDNGGEKTNSQCNILSVAISPGQPNIIYAGAETGVLFKSTDKGVNWTNINNSIASNAGITAIVVDPSNSNRMLFYSNAGLFLSNDGGTSFSRLNNYAFGEINRMVILPAGRILVASVTGIYYSDNSGSSWLLSNGTASSNNSLWDLVQKPGDATTLYAVAAQASTNTLLLYTSTNSGNSFAVQTVTHNGSLLTSSGARLAVSSANSAYIYCVTLQYNAGPAILRSTNSGSSWSVTAVSTTQSFGGENTSVGLGMSSGQGYYDLDIAVSPNNANQVIVGTTSTYRSADGGVNFSPIGGYLGSFGHKIHPDLQMIQTLGNDTYLASDGGVVYSNDFFGSNATVINKGLIASNYWGFGQGWDQDIVVGGRYHNGDAVLFESYATGNSLAMGGGEDATGHVFHGKANTVGFRDLGTYVIPNALSGNTLSSEYSNNEWPQDDYYGYFCSKLMIDPRYSNIYYLGKNNQLLKSTNSGLSYQALKDFGSKVWRFDIARSNPNTLYVCTESNGIQKTTNGGLSWTALSLPAGVSYQYYNADIAVSPLNADEVIFCMRYGSAANKVFRSMNGGQTWTNITGTTLNNKQVSYILYHGNNGSMYAVTQAVPAEVFWKDNSMSDWQLFTNGLPQNLQVWGGCGIFFRDNKLRLSTTRGIWETTLATPVIPVAQPMADKQVINCSADTIRFSDYSILQYSGAQWQWSFPGASYVSSVNVQKPVVTYSNPGVYSVTLKVTDTNGNTHTKTVDSMIVFKNNYCKADTLAGKSLVMKGTNTPISIGKANINSNSFSISCWIKPTGKQNSFAQLVCHDPYPGSSYGFGLGFSFLGYTPNLNLCYTDNLVGYGNSSSLIADSTRWNFVVLTYSATGVYIYLNGKRQLVRSGTMPVIDLSQTPFYINKDIHNQGGYYKGEIDEVKLYNYVLSETEVREKMHLLPSQPAGESGLLKYCQFNFIDPTTTTGYELIGKTLIAIPDTTYINNKGEVPVGTGIVQTLSAVNSGGMKDFSNLGMKLFLKSALGTVYPNGDLVGFRLRIRPYTMPDTRVPEPDSAWYIINNYGTNSSFTTPDSIVFESNKITRGLYSAGNFKLFTRGATSFGNSWGAERDSSDRVTYNAITNSTSITFSTGNNLTALGQMVIQCNIAPTYNFTGNGNWTDAANWTGNMIPPPYLDHGKIIINPVDGGSCILNTSMQLGAGGSLQVLPGKKFVVNGSFIQQ